MALDPPAQSHIAGDGAGPHGLVSDNGSEGQCLTVVFSPGRNRTTAGQRITGCLE